VFLRILGMALFVGLILGAPPMAPAQELTHSAPEWRTLGKGLSFTTVQVFQDREAVDTLSVVKIDPAFNAFRVFHHAPQSLTAWQEEIKAPVVFNASYYSPEGQPVGLIVTDGKVLGPLKNPQMRGMFVAEPQGMSPDLPRATILDLTTTRLASKDLPWRQGVQSFPLLLDSQGRLRVRKSDKRSNRTVIAADRQGNILVFNTGEDFFSLYDLARFLKASAFDIDSALNLDGGKEAQLYIKTRDFVYFSPPSWKSRLGNFLDSRRFTLPTVMGVFPRPN
jgi:uncharacterized protein YigE (DUF2233 family)